MSGRLTRIVASITVVAASALGTGAVAQASDASLRATVRSDVPAIQRSQAKILNGLAKLEQTGSPTALLAAIAAQNRNLTALEKRLAAQSASSANGAKGRTDVIAGLKLIVSSNRTLATALKRAKAKKPVSKAALTAARKADIKGNQDVTAGAKLLGA